MRRLVGAAADQNLLVETRASGHLLSAPQGLQHFLSAARAAAAEVIILDPLYSAHDQDENDTRAMAALCQSLLRLREASRAALIVVHHVRKSIGRYEIGSAFRGSSALHAVGDSLPAADPALSTVPHRRVALPVPLRRSPAAASARTRPPALWFSPAGQPTPAAPARRKVEPADVTQALTDLGGQARYNPLRQQIMTLTPCSKRTAQLAITEACQQGGIIPDNGLYRCPGSDSFSIVRMGSRPSGCPRPMRRGWLRRNRLIETLRRTLHPCWRVSGFCPVPLRGSYGQPISLVSLRAEALGYKTRRSPGCFLPGAPNPAFLFRLAVGIPALPIQASILSHAHHLPIASAAHHAAGKLRNQPEIIVKTSGAITAAHYSRGLR